MRARLFAPFVAILALAGCFGGSSVPDQLFTLSASESRPSAMPRTSGPGEAITVANPVVPQALQTPRIPVYVSDTSIQYLQDAQWVEDPAPLFARLVGEVVSARTGRVVLDATQYSHEPGVVVTGQLLKLGVDPTAMEAIVLFDVAAANAGGGIRSNRFEARVPIAEVTPEAVAPALNQAANQVAEQVAAWVGQ